MPPDTAPSEEAGVSHVMSTGAAVSRMHAAIPVGPSLHGDLAVPECPNPDGSGEIETVDPLPAD